ncbi:hypothetical protein M427DRAFT_295383 [Gonapodya prolifera JEL478]|uniref:Uncharacterized protein n=1 Tax=Gonapodya prolifera (strain JEL478) TaxID=1344416 RepID=A0A139AHU2_GONPJ|nr:hypothetical protein M427DRAFT_295383 [Gonapodya prolifera JEL478]|eukprot:KXS16259.1 hypothetical protein M427DRAFT_295383 [Gonapodya prolifera JEL478]
MASIPISRPSVQTLAPGRPVSVVQTSNFGIVPQTVSTNANATLPWVQNFLSTGKFPDANAAMAALRNQQRGLQVQAQLQGGGTMRPGTQPGFPIRPQGTQLTSAQIVMQPATQGQSTSGTSSNVRLYLTDSQKAGTRELMEQLMRDKFLGSIKKLAGAAEQTNGINQHLKAYLPKLLNIFSVLETQQAYILQNRDEWLFTPEDLKKVRTNLEKWAFQTTKELKNLGVNLTGLASLGVPTTANPPAGSIPPNAVRPNNISAPTMNNIQRSNTQSTANQLLAQMQASVNRMGTQQRRNPIGGTIGYPPQDEIPAIKPATAAQQSRIAPKRAPAKSAPKQPFPTSQHVTSVPIEISDSPPHDSDLMMTDTPVESTVVTPSATEAKPFAPPAPDPALVYMIKHVDVVDPFAGVAAMVREFERSLKEAPGMDWGWVEVDEEFPDVENDEESDDEDVNKMWVDMDPQAYVIEQIFKKGAKVADTKGKSTAFTEGNKLVAI